MELITRDAVEEDGGVYYVVPAGTASPSDAAITAANVLTLDVCRLVANQMKVSRRRGHKKAGGSKYIVVTSTEGMQDLLDDENLLKRAMVPGNTNKPVMDNGLESYDVYNLRFIEYNYPVITNGTTPIYHTYVFGENAYAVMDLSSAGIEMKRFGFEAKKGDNLGQIASLGWITMGFGAQVLDPVACTIIHHAVKNPLTRPTDIYAAQN
jgi:N4-gp56 family major capsid protein